MSAAATIATSVLLVAWVFYPLWLSLLAAGRKASQRSTTGNWPTVSVIVATREAAEVVARRVQDIWAQDYPRQLLQVIVAVDFRSIHGVTEIEAALGDRAEVVRGDAPGGKAAGLNAGVRAATGTILLFADSQQTFSTGAIRQLVQVLEDSQFGAVSGMVDQASGDGLMDLYWRYELLIRRGQAAAHSIVSTTGQIQALRRDLWEPLPAELICDDLQITMQTVMRGHRVGFCEEARAIDRRRFTRSQHFQRKVRTLTGLFQFVNWHPEVLDPRRNPIWVHFVCHKLVRFATPYLALIALAGLVAQMARWLGPEAMMQMAAGVVAAALAIVLVPFLRRRVGGEIIWALVVLAIPLVALRNGLQQKWNVWHAHQPLTDARG